MPCLAGHPTDVIFLTCDAFGVLPPVSKLSPAQAMYHFISGYTAKVAGTEVGVTEPQATFSPCFGGPFLVWHPLEIRRIARGQDDPAPGQRLARQHGLERRRPRRRRPHEAQDYSRLIDAIHGGVLARQPTAVDPVFGFAAVSDCPGVPKDILIPRNTWADKAAYDAAARRLAGLFRDNFKQYETGASLEVRNAGPRTG